VACVGAEKKQSSEAVVGGIDRFAGGGGWKGRQVDKSEVSEVSEAIVEQQTVRTSDGWCVRAMQNKTRARVAMLVEQRKVASRWEKKRGVPKR
jgi:hypothetical protein